MIAMSDHRNPSPNNRPPTTARAESSADEARAVDTVVVHERGHWANVWAAGGGDSLSFAGSAWRDSAALNLTRLHWALLAFTWHHLVSVVFS